MEEVNTIEKPAARITVAFYKSDVINVFERKSDGVKIATIAFPKTSKYAGYVWYFPHEWINSNDDSKQEKEYSFNPDKRWVRVKADDQITIVKSQLNEDTNTWHKIDELKISSNELKESMKRKFIQNTDENEEESDDE